MQSRGHTSMLTLRFLTQLLPYGIYRDVHKLILRNLTHCDRLMCQRAQMAKPPPYTIYDTIHICAAGHAHLMPNMPLNDDCARVAAMYNRAECVRVILSQTNTHVYNNTMLRTAIQHESLAVLQLLIPHADKDYLHYALKNNSLRAADILYSAGMRASNINHTIYIVIARGLVSALEWICARDDVEFDHTHLHYACAHEDMYVWMRVKVDPRQHSYIQHVALSMGNLPVCKHIHAEWPFVDRGMTVNASTPEVLEWLYANHLWQPWENAHRQPAFRGNIAASEWLIKHNVPLSPILYRCAASTNSVAYMDWLLANGIEPPTDTPLAAAEGGHIEALEWCESNGIIIYPAVCHGIDLSSKKMLMLFHWVHKRVPLDTGAYFSAIIAQSSTVIAWLLENNIQYDVLACTSAIDAADDQNPELETIRSLLRL